MIFNVLEGWAEVGDGPTGVTNASTAVAAQAAASILNFGIGRSPSMAGIQRQWASDSVICFAARRKAGHGDWPKENVVG